MNAADTAAIQWGGGSFCERVFSCTDNAAGTAANRLFGLAILRNRLFLYRQSSPKPGYIQRRFSALSVWFAYFERFVRFAHTHGFTPMARQSVTTLVSLAPLPPFIVTKTD